MPDVECFFDCSSPWTYFAFHNLLRMQQELGMEIAWRPILVGGVFNAVNPSVHNSREKPVPVQRSHYGVGRIRRIGRAISASACTIGRPSFR